MKHKRLGFSMVELLVIIGFIGFIVIVELMILNNKMNEYATPYYTVYNALKKASYNILADIYCPNPTSSDPDCQVGPRDFPTNSEELCLRLSEFINTSLLNCSADELDITDKADNFVISSPRMIASNSYRFHFSGLKEIEIRDDYGNLNPLQYFVVYVDLNGRKRPNRLTCDGGRILPDIVPFVITRRGEVIPMGLPVYNSAYMTAKIKYPARLAADETMEDRTSGSMNYYSAIYGAWPEDGTKNVKANMDIPFSIMFADKIAYDGSDIKQCYDGRIMQMKHELTYKDEAINRESEGCKAGTYNCRVVIDSSTNARW